MVKYIKDSQPSAFSNAAPPETATAGVDTEKLPTMYDLPSEDPEEPGLPDYFHLLQPRFLDDTCCPGNYPSDRVLTGSDVNVYYDLHHPYWYKRPDWFVVVGVPWLYEGKDARLSYVIWQEKVSPTVIVELLSPGTDDQDLGLAKSAPNQPPTKWEVYERILKVPYYFVFSRYTNELKFFRLVKNRYQEQVLTEPRVWIPELQLGLGVWFGKYKEWERDWLRWYDADGNWIPTPEELQEQEQLAKERERLAKEQERLAKESALEKAQEERLAKESALEQAQEERLAKESALEQAQEERLAKESALEKADRLAQRLRELGINPEEL